MFLETNIFLLLLSRVHLLLGQQQQGQCSVDSLAPFGDSDDRDTPDRDRFQAIVPAYTFQCSGRVTEWRACVLPGGMSSEQYYIQFQVWRRTASIDDGECYELVGSNTPQDGENMPEFLSPPGGGGSNPLNRCVVLPVREDRQIEFQSGDVVGYYVDYENDDSNDNYDGIQWIEHHDNVVVHYRDGLSRDDIQSYYAIDGHNPTECGFPISGDSILYTLASSMSAAPIISLSIATSVMTSSPPPAPTSPSPAPAVVTPSPTPSSTTMRAQNTSPTTDRRSSSNVASNTASMVPSLPPSKPIIIPISSPSPPAISNGGINLSSTCISSDDMCRDVTEGTATGTYHVSIAAGVSVSLLTLIIATAVVILVLLWLRRRKVKNELVDNVAYNSHSSECEIKTDANTAYHTVSNDDVITATNAAYAAVPSTSGDNDVDIVTSTNEAYVPTDIATSVNAVYEAVNSDSATYYETCDANLEYDYPRHEN